MTRLLRTFKEIGLTVGAIGGTLCIGLAAASMMFNLTPLIVQSGSMEPTVSTGSLLVTQRTPAAELRKFAKYHDFRPNGKPSVSGETATVKVQLFDAGGQQVGEVEWAFVQEGGHWKLKSAPLP